MAARIDTFTDEEFIKIVQDSDSMKDVARKLGYKSYSGDSGVRIRTRIDKLGISTDHFSLGHKRPMKRSAENIFIENSTAS